MTVYNLQIKSLSPKLYIHIFFNDKINTSTFTYLNGENATPYKYSSLSTYYPISNGMKA